MGNKNKKEKKSIAGLSLPVVLLLIAVLALGGGVAAKYVFGASGGENVYSAEEFYFTSNMLTVEGASYILPANTTAIEFSLSNHEDKLRVSDSDIEYKIKVTNKSKMLSFLSAKSTDDWYRLDRGNPDPMTTVQVKVNSTLIEGLTLEPGNTYTVEVEGKAGYKKILKADFTISEADAKVYKHLEKDSSGAYVLLTVWTENVAGDAKISVDVAGLIPDTTDPVQAGVTNYTGTGYGAFDFTDGGESGSFKEAYSSRVYRFFVDSAADIGNITEGSFTVTVGGKTAEPGEP